MAVLIFLGLTLLAMTVVGIALARVAWRTRRSPETLIAAGLLLIGPLGQPALFASGIGRLPAGEVDLGLFILSTLMIVAGLGSLFFFTAQVFHSKSVVAHGVAGIGSLIVAVAYIGACVHLVGLDAKASSNEAMSAWRFWIQIPLLLCFGWPAWASLSQHLQLRKQLAIGLADPVVANRFLLFATGMGAAFLMMVVNSTLSIFGLSSTIDLAPRLVLATGTTVFSIGMYLAFVPPSGYLRWVRGEGDLMGDATEATR